MTNVPISTGKMEQEPSPRKPDPLGLLLDPVQLFPCIDKLDAFEDGVPLRVRRRHEVIPEIRFD